MSGSWDSGHGPGACRARANYRSVLELREMEPKYRTDTVTTLMEAFLGAEEAPSRILCYLNDHRKE